MVQNGVARSSSTNMNRVAVYVEWFNVAAFSEEPGMSGNGADIGATRK
jgi:hypothetical protein